MDMDLDAEMWDNKTITSGLKNYFRSAHFTSCASSLTAIISIMLEMCDSVLSMT